ncbi:MAG: NADH-quinone oxidoreductase subunit NuoK [Gemmataceae bacterium]|jgi:NADH-quinone oxidoreductase subunit K
MNSPDLPHYLACAAVLFVLGLVGFLARRNLILMFLSVELMVQGVALNFVAFARFRGNLDGQSFVLFMLTVAACEAALALALILALYRTQASLDVSLWQNLREDDLDATEDDEPLPGIMPEAPLPSLPVAGIAPARPEESNRV